MLVPIFLLSANESNPQFFFLFHAVNERNVFINAAVFPFGGYFALRFVYVHVFVPELWFLQQWKYN